MALQAVAGAISVLSEKKSCYLTVKVPFRCNKLRMHAPLIRSLRNYGAKCSTRVDFASRRSWVRLLEDLLLVGDLVSWSAAWR